MKYLAALALLSLSACATMPAQTPQTLRVMSYNIRYANDSDRPNWAERRDALARQVAFTDPDIVGLQEAQPGQVAYLAGQWPGYEHYGLGRNDGVNGETTTLFWRRDRFERLSVSHQWCSPTPDRPGKGWDAAWPRTVTRVILRDRISGKLLDVRNTHLDNEGAVARESCARQIAGVPAEPQAVVIVMGDMNSGPDSAPYRVLTGDTLGLKDARKAASVDFGPTGTFNDFDIAATQGEAIDHVFVSQAAKVLRYGVLTDSFGGKVISDHFPVVADLRLE